MSNIFEFDGFRPVIDESSFIHPNASIIGNVIIGKNCYIGPGCSLRGDFGGIEVGDGCNIQDNCTVHMFPGVIVKLYEDAHIGHGAIIHGAEIGKNVMVGMNAVVMDEAVVGESSIIGALCFVPTGMIIPGRKVAVGNPAKIIKDVTDEMLKWKSQGTRLYQKMAAESINTQKPCEPLRKIPETKKLQEIKHNIWKKS